jgi:hypothetical protein
MGSACSAWLSYSAQRLCNDQRPDSQGSLRTPHSDEESDGSSPDPYQQLEIERVVSPLTIPGDVIRSRPSSSSDRTSESSSDNQQHRTPPTGRRNILVPLNAPNGIYEGLTYDDLRLLNTPINPADCVTSAGLQDDSLRLITSIAARRLQRFGVPILQPPTGYVSLHRAQD